jgi:hypothetical protein
LAGDRSGAGDDAAANEDRCARQQIAPPNVHWTRPSSTRRVPSGSRAPQQMPAWARMRTRATPISSIAPSAVVAFRNSTKFANSPDDQSETLRKLADTGASGVGSESTQKSPRRLTGMTVSAALITSSSAVRITVITQRLGVLSVALEPKLNYHA